MTTRPRGPCGLGRRGRGLFELGATGVGQEGDGAGDFQVGHVATALCRHGVETLDGVTGQRGQTLADATTPGGGIAELGRAQHASVVAGSALSLVGLFTRARASVGRHEFDLHGAHGHDAVGGGLGAEGIGARRILALRRDVHDQQHDDDHRDDERGRHGNHQLLGGADRALMTGLLGLGRLAHGVFRRRWLVWGMTSDRQDRSSERAIIGGASTFTQLDAHRALLESALLRP